MDDTSASILCCQGSDSRALLEPIAGRAVAELESARRGVMYDQKSDTTIRATVFAWLQDQVSRHGDVLPRSVLVEGLQIDGRRVPLLGPQGIFKPAIMDLPLSITTSPNGPYDDAFEDNDLLRYRYRGTDPYHRENAGLREIWRRRLPLVYFHGVATSRYVAIWPVYIVADDMASLSFTVAADDAKVVTFDRVVSTAGDDASADARRRYITTTVRHRLHQRAFRERVLAAYRHQCAFCRFRHDELLDAAHIVPDAEERGEPVVSNGLSLCKLHHAAFDHGFLGLRPDFILEVRPDILAESDGPTLKHGLQQLHGSRIILPRRSNLRPERDRVEERYRRFLASA